MFMFRMAKKEESGEINEHFPADAGSLSSSVIACGSAVKLTAEEQTIEERKREKLLADLKAQVIFHLFRHPS